MSLYQPAAAALQLHAVTITMAISPKRKKHHAHMHKSSRRLLRLRLRLLFPPLISACFLLLVTFFSLFFTPSPVNTQYNDLVRSRLNSHSQEDSGSAVSFHVPATGGAYERDLWTSMHSHGFSACSDAPANFAKADVKTHPDRYLLIATSGGLNQQRTGIIDAVVAAYLLNATLIVPELDHTSFWNDKSNFSELFDADWFITFLQNEVRVIKQLPNMGTNFVAPYTLRVPRKCTPECYKDRVLPVLIKKRVSVKNPQLELKLSSKL